MLSEKPWKLDVIVPLLLGIVFCFSVFWLLEGVAQHFSGKTKLDENSMIYLLFATLSLHGSILLVTSIFLWVRRINLAEAFGFSISGVARALLLGMVVAVLFLPIGATLETV